MIEMDYETQMKNKADEHNAHDLSIEHLTKRKSIAVAKKVKKYLQDKYPWCYNGGCRMFSEDFTYVTGGGDRGFTTHDANAVLSLVMDGGDFYDFFSYNGEGAYYGLDDAWKLEQFIESLGYHAEWITSYCLGVYEQ